MSPAPVVVKLTPSRTSVQGSDSNAKRAGQRSLCRQMNGDSMKAMLHSGEPRRDSQIHTIRMRPPLTSGTGSHRLGRSEALSKTKVCAIFLFVVTGFSVVHHLFVGISTLVVLLMDPAAMQGMNGPQGAEQIGQVIGGLAGGTIGIVMDILVLLGAYNLMNLKKYSLAMTGAVIACIPCCGPCFVLGIPFGIWALVLLNNPEIKPHFEG